MRRFADPLLASLEEHKYIFQRPSRTANMYSIAVLSEVLYL
jgi:hypothetical protein